jgi:hypothetical protein
MAERYFNTNEIALEKLKAKELNENTKVWQDWAFMMLTLRIL